MFATLEMSFAKCSEFSWNTSGWSSFVDVFAYVCVCVFAVLTSVQIYPTGISIRRGVRMSGEYAENTPKTLDEIYEKIY